MAASSSSSSSSSSTASTARSHVEAAKKRKRGRAETTSKAAKISPSSHPQQQQQQAVVAYMPLDVVFEVMCILPPRSIARCRCVCKQWRSLTYDPNLVKQHQSINSTNLFLLFPLYAAPTAYAPTICLYRLGDDDRVLDCSFHLKVGHLLSYQLSNPVNGLVCAFDNRHCDHPIQYLLNPFTRDVVKLPPSTSCAKEMWNSSSVGLGFDATTGAYKLVRLFRIDDHDEERCGCEVLSVGPNQDWQYVGEVLCRVPWLRPVFFKGAILWPVLGPRCATRRFPEPYIMEFDLKDHKLRLIPTPKPLPDGLHHVDLLESEGHLCLARSPSRLDLFLTIWRLEDHPSQIWTKLHYIDMSTLVSLKSPLSFIGIRGHEILVDVTEQTAWCLPALTIWSYDLHTETLREVCRNYRPEGLRLGFITESLVSPRSLTGSISH